MDGIEQPTKLWPDEHHAFSGFVFPVFFPHWTIWHDDLLNSAIPLVNPDPVTNLDRLSCKVAWFHHLRANDWSESFARSKK